MNLFAKKYWPLLSVMSIYWGTVLVLVLLSINRNQAHLIYPLDDTYIHMAMAKNAVLYHVWGVTKYAFTSSTSSPLWTALLAITYLAFGVNEVLPLILNVLFGTFLIIVSYFFLAKYINNTFRTFIILLAAVFVTPLPSLTIAGMEHVLHAFLSLCFAYLSMLTLSTNTKPFQRNSVLLTSLAPFVTMARYEGIFLVFVVCVLLLLKKRVFYSAVIGIAALLPVILYGVWSLTHGWYFLPNSVLLKGFIPTFSLNGISKLFVLLTPGKIHILLLLISSLLLLLFIYLKKEKQNDGRKYAILIFVVTLLFHMQFASVGRFFRYEAYLVLLGVIVIGISVNDLLPEKYKWDFNKRRLSSRVMITLFIIVICFPFGYRALKSISITPRATTNIYEQQYQMGTFIKQFYQGKTIVANDIGAITYLADVQLIDIVGLGSLEPLKLNLRNDFTTKQIYDLSHQGGGIIAIVYNQAFDENGGLPLQWMRIGQWRIPHNVVCAFDMVSLFAVVPSASVDLLKNLKQFARELPEEVMQYGEYTEK